MQNLLKNKSFIILSIFLILAIFPFSSSFASTHEFEDSTIITNDTYDNEYAYKFIYFIDNDTTARVCLFYSNSEIFLSGTGFTTKGNGSFKEYELTCWSRDLPSTFDFSNIDIASFSESGSTSLAYFENGNFSYSNYDIKDTDGNVVFQGAPQGTQLSQIVEQAETEKTLAEIIAILPMILVIIVGLIGLRKALAFLQKLLRKS